MWTIFDVLEELLLELKSNRLVVTLIKDSNGRGIRAVESQNPFWYRSLCYKYTTNKNNGKKLKTKICRKNVLSILKTLLKDGCSRSMYADDLIYIAYERYEVWKDLDKQALLSSDPPF